MKCEYCGEPTRRRRRFCSTACWASYRVKPLTCKKCGEDFDGLRLVSSNGRSAYRVHCYTCRPVRAAVKP